MASCAVVTYKLLSKSLVTNMATFLVKPFTLKSRQVHQRLLLHSVPQDCVCLVFVSLFPKSRRQSLH